MNRRSFVLGCTSSVFAVARVIAQNRLSRESIREILVRRIDIEKKSVGMAVATVDRRRKQFVAYGRSDPSRSLSITADTRFEIGSVTKVFTALVLADMVRHGELGFDDPLARYLPPGFRVPEVNNRAITLADLATHTAGFPLFPPIEGNPLELIARYRIEDLRDWLAGYTLKRVPGSQWEYSNVGYALLGLAISYRAGTSYSALLQQRIIAPLRLRNTFSELQPGMAQQLTLGHDKSLKVVPPLELGIFSPAGCLRSTIRDLLTFVEAMMPRSGSHLEAAAQSLLNIRRPAPPIGGDQALGWELIGGGPNMTLVSKDGVTAGQAASVVFDPAARVGVVVLSNTLPQIRKPPPDGGIGAADLARHLIRPSIPLG